MSDALPVRGAVVLCGGGSRRMGRDKASVPCAGEPLLSRTVKLVSHVVAPEAIVCVAAQGQTLPVLPKVVRIIRDPAPDQGPLAALATGLRELREECDAVLAIGCDAPLLEPKLADRLFAEIGESNCVVPDVQGSLQPLLAVYRADACEVAERLLRAGERSLKRLLEELNPSVMDQAAVSLLDPALTSFLNCNNPEELRKAESLLATE